MFQKKKKNSIFASMNLRCLSNTVFLSDNFRIIYVSMIFFGTDDKNGLTYSYLSFC